MATLKLICLYGVILTWPVLGGLTLLDIIDLDFWLIMTIHAYFIIFHMMLKAKSLFGFCFLLRSTSCTSE